MLQDPCFPLAGRKREGEQGNNVCACMLCGSLVMGLMLNDTDMFECLNTEFRDL